MSENWPYKIDHVSPGEPVQAGIVSRPDRALTERTDYLKDRLDAAEAGRAIFDLDATVLPDVLPGQPVFWNAQEKRYEPALVLVENDTPSQTLVVRPCSECVGMCYRKSTANRADIVLRGLVTFDNLNSAIGPQVEPGKYYLSAVTPGKLTKQKPPVTVAVCYVFGPRDNCSDKPLVLVCPQVRDFLDEHTHYRFELLPQFAGTSISITGATPTNAGTVSINNANANLPGWLPANHAIFNGKAPAGAKFGYNLKKHPALERVWPPIPIQSVALLWDKGAGLVGATEIPLGATGVARADVNGIWWMSDCRGDVPFNESTPATPVVGNCPREEVMRVIVVFLRLLFGNNRSVVTSLDNAVNSPIEITNCDGVPAQTGDLKLDLDLVEVDCAPLADDELPDDENLARSVELLGTEQAGKVYSDIVAANPTLNANKNRLKKSWATEGVIVYGNNDNQLSAVGSWSRPLTDDEKRYHYFTDGNGNPVTEEILVQQGLVKLSFDSQYATRELSPQIIRLDDALERIYMDIPYLGFPSGQDSAVRVRLNVPYVNLPDGDVLQLRISVQAFTRGGNATAASIGQLFLSYRVINAPVNATARVPLPTEDSDTENILNTVEAARDNIVKVESTPISGIKRGDTVLVTLFRPNTDAVQGELGVLRISGILTKPN